MTTRDPEIHGLALAAKVLLEESNAMYERGVSSSTLLLLVGALAEVNNRAAKLLPNLIRNVQRQHVQLRDEVEKLPEVLREVAMKSLAE